MMGLAYSSISPRSAASESEGSMGISPMNGISISAANSAPAGFPKMYHFSAPRARDVAHVLDKPYYRLFHHLSHVH